MDEKYREKVISNFKCRYFLKNEIIVIFSAFLPSEKYILQNKKGFSGMGQ